jgi:hypothetical protein
MPTATFTPEKTNRAGTLLVANYLMWGDVQNITAKISEFVIDSTYSLVVN